MYCMVVAGYSSVIVVVLSTIHDCDSYYILQSLKPVYCDGPALFKAITVVDLSE